MTALTEQSLRHFIVLLTPCTCEQNVAFVALPFSNGTITAVGGGSSTYNSEAPEI